MSAIRMELNRRDFFPRLWANASLVVERLGPTSHRFAAFLWSNIDAGTVDRSGWDGAAWQAHLGYPANRFYAVFNDYEPVGCFEIVREPRLMASAGGNVRISGFGLLPEFTGESIGPTLLTRVVEKAFALGAAKIYFTSDEALAPAMQIACESQGFKTS
ncbi:MAG: GNAT family N-acetyltransferase [Gammaproteobacteria bacterium]|nr:GNAT family N-acetyltransferase [Gammaproteobacteria bacterium]